MQKKTAEFRSSEVIPTASPTIIKGQKTIRNTALQKE